MSQDFNGKTAQEIVDHLGKGQPSFAEMREAIESLDPARRKEVIDLIENIFVESVRGFAEEPGLIDYMEEDFRRLSGRFADAAERREEEKALKGMQVASRLIAYIVECKGAAAHQTLR